MYFMVPISLIVSIAISICVAVYFHHRNRAEVHRTIRTIVEQGQPLSPDLLRGLGQAETSRAADLRRGVLIVSLGVAIAVLGLVVNEGEFTRAALGISALPILLGVAYLGLWKLAPGGPGMSESSGNPG